jgi:hypothetical protein
MGNGTWLQILIVVYFQKPKPGDLKKEITEALSEDVKKYNQSEDSQKRLDALRDEVSMLPNLKDAQDKGMFVCQRT